MKQTMKLAVRVCVLALIAAVLMPMFASAAAPDTVPQPEVIRVSCPLQDGFFQVDENGKYSGYTYEYLMKIAQHTGWNYDFKTYVPANENLMAALEQLENGEIDLLTGMVYNDALAKTYAFTSLPYGQSNYVLMADVNNEQLNRRSFSELQGLRVALSKTADTTNRLFEDFCERMGLYFEVVDGIGEECKLLVQNGKADLVVSKDIVKSEGFKIITEIAAEPFYFAANKENPALAAKLSRVISEIQDVDPYYNAKLHDQFFNFESDLKLSLIAEEQAFLETTPSIRMIVLTDRSPIQSYDSETGEFKGIIIDLIRKISAESGLSIEFVPAKNLAQAKEMLDHREADAFAGFPNSYSSAAQYNLLLTSPIFTMPVVRLNNISGDAENVETLVSTSIRLFEDQKNIVYKEDLTEIFKLIDKGKYQEAYVNGYMAQQYLRRGEYPHTVLVPTPYSNYELCIGVSRFSDARLICILEQMISKIKMINVEDIVYQNTSLDHDISILDMVKRNPIEVLGPTLLVFVLLTTALCIMVVKTRRLNKIISMEKNKYQEISVKDALSHTYNNDAFKSLCRDYLSSGNRLSGTFLMCDIDDFKLVNDTCGHVVGDQVIQKVGEVLLELFPNDIVGRLGGDEFAVLIKGVSDLASVERHCKALLACSTGICEQCKFTLSIGASVFTSQVEFDALYESADKALYLVKKRDKNDYEILRMSSIAE